MPLSGDCSLCSLWEGFLFRSHALLYHFLPIPPLFVIKLNECNHPGNFNNIMYSNFISESRLLSMFMKLSYISCLRSLGSSSWSEGCSHCHTPTKKTYYDCNTTLWNPILVFLMLIKESEMWMNWSLTLILKIHGLLKSIIFCFKLKDNWKSLYIIKSKLRVLFCEVSRLQWIKYIFFYFTNIIWK